MSHIKNYFYRRIMDLLPFNMILSGRIWAFYWSNSSATHWASLCWSWLLQSSGGLKAPHSSVFQFSAGQDWLTDLLLIVSWAGSGELVTSGLWAAWQAGQVLTGEIGGMGGGRPGLATSLVATPHQPPPIGWQGRTDSARQGDSYLRLRLL